MSEAKKRNLCNCPNCQTDDCPAGQQLAAVIREHEGVCTVNHSMEREIAKLRYDLASVTKERDALRETNTRLNRRCQLADSAAQQNVDECRKQRVGLGRALAGWAATKAEEELAAKDAEIARMKKAMVDAQNIFCAASHVGPFSCVVQDIIRKALSASGEGEREQAITRMLMARVDAERDARQRKKCLDADALSASGEGEKMVKQ